MTGKYWCCTAEFEQHTDGCPNRETSEPTKTDDYVKLSMAELCRLYAVAYHDGHHDTCEGVYTDVLPQDMDTYHKDAVQTFLDEF